MTDNEKRFQDAQLIAEDGSTLVVTVRVPAFPTNPGIVEWDDRYFAHGTVGYGPVECLTYTEVTLFKVPGYGSGQPDASSAALAARAVISLRNVSSVIPFSNR